MCRNVKKNDLLAPISIIIFNHIIIIINKYMLISIIPKVIKEWSIANEIAIHMVIVY